MIVGRIEGHLSLGRVDPRSIHQQACPQNEGGDSSQHLRSQRESHPIERTTPPSTRRAAPFVPEAHGLETYTTIAAISSGDSKRFKSDDGRTDLKNSVSTCASSVPREVAMSFTNFSTPSDRVGPA